MAEVLADTLVGRLETSPRALQHLSNTYRAIANSLKASAMPSDATLGAVVSMAIHEDLTGHPERSKAHMDALQQLVGMRGGIDLVGTNQMLVLKLCR